MTSAGLAQIASSNLARSSKQVQIQSASLDTSLIPAYSDALKSRLCQFRLLSSHYFLNTRVDYTPAHQAILSQFESDIPKTRIKK